MDLAGDSPGNFSFPFPAIYVLGESEIDHSMPNGTGLSTSVLAFGPFLLSNRPLHMPLPFHCYAYLIHCQANLKRLALGTKILFQGKHGISQNLYKIFVHPF